MALFLCRGLEPLDEKVPNVLVLLRLLPSVLVIVMACYRVAWASLNWCKVIPVTPFRLVTPPRAARLV